MLPADHALTIEFEALEALRKQLEDERGTLRQNVRAAVNAVTTVAKLLAVWPEAAELLPTSAAPKPQLPAVNVQVLNAAIGLPTGDTPQ